MRQDEVFLIYPVFFFQNVSSHQEQTRNETVLCRTDQNIPSHSVSASPSVKIVCFPHQRMQTDFVSSFCNKVTSIPRLQPPLLIVFLILTAQRSCPLNQSGAIFQRLTPCGTVKRHPFRDVKSTHISASLTVAIGCERKKPSQQYLRLKNRNRQII